ncbi:MAG: efflux RND transporter periplasmic adaptor subunit [Planctomycetota bacterium]
MSFLDQILTDRQPTKKRQKWASRRVRVLGALVVFAGTSTGLGVLRAGDSAQSTGPDEHSEPTAETGARPLPVVVSPVEIVDGYEREERFTGVVEARRASDLGFRLGGELLEVVATEGARVEAGAALARLDTDALRTTLDVRRAQLDAGRALLAELVAGPRTEQIEASRGRVAAIESRLSRRELDLERVRRAFDEGAAVESELDAAVFAVDESRGELTEASERLRELETGTRVERVAAQRAEVARLEAEVVRIEVDLDDAVLKAPFAGTVAKRLFDEGSVVGAGQAVLRLVETGELEAWVGVTGEVAGELRLGESYELEGPAGVVSGVARAVMPEVDPVTRTTRVVFAVGSSDTLRAGDVVRLVRRTRVAERGFWVPMEAVTEGRRGLWRVYVAEPGPSDGERVVAADVELLFAESDRAFVRGAVADEALLIESGVQRVAPGQRVRAVRSGPALRVAGLEREAISEGGAR